MYRSAKKWGEGKKATPIPKESNAGTAKSKMLRARLDCACSWTVMVGAIYRPRPIVSTGLSRIEHLTLTIKALNFETSADAYMCSYGGYHGTFNVTRMCNSTKSGMWSPGKLKCALYEKQWAKLNKMDF
jgi:hypothetical protein